MMEGGDASGSPVEIKENAEQLHDRCISTFSASDSIMDVNVGKVMKEYISSGGKPEVVVKYLSENYRGYAQMCNLLCHWLRLSGVDDSSVCKMIEEELKSIIVDKFDPKQANTIFTEGASAPTWLEFMIMEPEWRSLLYQLSEAHTNCLMLNFAIQRISDLGHHGEIASLTTASTYFSVFNRVLFDTLAHIYTLDESTIPRALSDLKKMCCHSQHTYLYVQAVIHGLIRSMPNTYHLKRLSEELEAAVHDKGPVIRRLNFLFSDIAAFPIVAGSLSTMLASLSTNPGDVIKLHGEYSKPDPPPVEFLHHPDVFDLFIRDLFNPAKTINPQHKNKYFYVLAYAASVQERKNGTEREVDKSGLDYTIEALESIQPICQRNSFGSDLQASNPILKAKLSIPVVAMGILHWIRSNFTDPSYYTTSYGTLSTPLHLDLVREICSRHPLQRPAILDVLVKSFEMEPDLDALAALDLKRNLLDNIIYIMRCGYVLPVMDTIEHWTPKIDQSLIRYFVIQVLDMVEPPFSLSFVQSLLRIVGSPATTEALKSTDSRELVKDFISHCNTEKYTWSAANKTTLERLTDVFSN